MRVTATATVTHLCPFVDEIDHGVAIVTWESAAPELHEVRDYLDGFHDEHLTHEDFTQRVADRFGAEVVTRWTTAGMEVEVHAVPRNESE